MNYQSYTVNDFLQDDAFLRWVLSPDEATDRHWQQVIDQHPSQQKTIQQARQLILNVAQAEEKPLSEQHLTELWNRIDQQTGVVRPWPTRRKWWRVAAVAASIGLVSVFGHWFLKNRATPDSPNGGQLSRRAEAPGNSWTTFTNPNAEPVWLLLPDSSRVSLQPQSRLAYAMPVGSAQRQVRLMGAAFFEVTRNPTRPFLVYADHTVTKVLGTSFWVRAYQRDKQVQVTVRTGKVSVYTKTAEPLSRHSLTLTPNQMAVFQRTNGQLYKELVRKPLPVGPAETVASLVYTDEPVAHILRHLERAYGIPILFDEKSLSDQCILTADLTREPYLDAIAKVCRSQGLSYEVIDGQVLITGHCAN